MTTPTFKPNVPEPLNKFNDSQGDFLGNFTTLYNAFLKNHVALDAPSNAGNHTVIQLIEQNANNQFQTDIGEMSIYCKPVPNQGDQLFLRYQGNQPEFQLSAYQIYSVTPGNNQTSFFTYLPGRVLAFFGSITTTLTNGGVPLLLRPPIATNIITVNFTVNSSQPNFPPMVTVPTANNNGFFDRLLLFLPAQLLNFPVQNLTFFYVVLANI